MHEQWQKHNKKQNQIRACSPIQVSRGQGSIKPDNEKKCRKDMKTRVDGMNGNRKDHRANQHLERSFIIKRIKNLKSAKALVWHVVLYRKKCDMGHQTQSLQRCGSHRYRFRTSYKGRRTNQSILEELKTQIKLR